MSFLLPASVLFPVLFCQKRKWCSSVWFSQFLPFVFLFFSSDKHPKVRLIFTLLIATYKKTWVLASACSSIAAYHSLGNKQTEKHPRRVYSTPVKCATKATRALRTLRRVYTTLRGSHPCNVFDCQFDCGSFDSTKNSASVTPFNM